jgi:hypothetical protein
MAQCPTCQSTNVVVTEEVYTRKGRAFYRFWQTIIIVVILLVGFAMEAYAFAFIAAIIGGLSVNVFSLINASKQSTSRTKLSCLACKTKVYL